MQRLAPPTRRNISRVVSSAFDDMKAAHAHVDTDHKKGNVVMTVKGCD